MLGLKLLKLSVTDTADVPDPIDFDGVLLDVASVLLVPHSNHAVVDALFGFTLPFNIAPLDVTELAALVVIVGTVASISGVYSSTVENIVG